MSNKYTMKVFSWCIYSYWFGIGIGIGIVDVVFCLANLYNLWNQDKTNQTYILGRGVSAKVNEKISNNMVIYGYSAMPLVMDDI